MSNVNKYKQIYHIVHTEVEKAQKSARRAGKNNPSLGYGVTRINFSVHRLKDYSHVKTSAFEISTSELIKAGVKGKQGIVAKFIRVFYPELFDDNGLLIETENSNEDLPYDEPEVVGLEDLDTVRSRYFEDEIKEPTKH
jgi:hypothetical protein